MNCSRLRMEVKEDSLIRGVRRDEFGCEQIPPSNVILIESKLIRI